MLLLTATPIETDLEEIYNLVTLLRPGQFATPAQFRKQFVNTADPTSPKDRHQLRSLLSEVMVRNTRAGSGLALPPRFVSTVCVDAHPDEQRAYALVTQLLRDFASDRGARLVASTLMLQAGSSPAALAGTLETVTGSQKPSQEFRAACEQLLRAVAPRATALGTTRKATALLEILASHRQQALVFTRYRRTLEYLSAQLERAKLRHVTFHGGLTTAQKQASFDEFAAGAPVLIATEIVGEGQNLQFCSLLVNFDLPWNPMQIEQRIGRLHRMGQTSEVRVWNLCGRGTAEERVLDILDGRLHLFELVVGEMELAWSTWHARRAWLRWRHGNRPARGRAPARASRGCRVVHACRRPERGVVRNGVADMVECLVGRLEYQFAVAGWVAETDDRHEGVVYAGVSARGGHPDDRMERMLWDAALNAADGYREATERDVFPGTPCFATGGPVATRSIERLRNTLERRALASAEPLRAAALRRQAREYRQTTEYYDAMVKEVQAPRRKIDPVTLESRVAAVVVDRDAKIRDLEQRFRMRVTLTPVARIVADVATTTVRTRVRRRQSERILELHLPTGAQVFDGLSCDGCLGHTHRPALCDEKLHVLCETCIPEARGRVPCPACRGVCRP